MKIKKKESIYNEKLGNIKPGNTIALGCKDGEKDNYYIVNNFYVDDFPFSAIEEKEGDFNYTMVTNLSTGCSIFISSDTRCKILDLEIREL